MDFIATPPNRYKKPEQVQDKSLKRPTSEEQIKILARLCAENQPSITEGKLFSLFSAECGVGIATFNKVKRLLVQVYPNISLREREIEYCYNPQNNNNNNNNLEKKKLKENNEYLSPREREFSSSESISHDESDNSGVLQS